MLSGWEDKAMDTKKTNTYVFSMSNFLPCIKWWIFFYYFIFRSHFLTGVFFLKSCTFPYTQGWQWVVDRLSDRTYSVVECCSVLGINDSNTTSAKTDKSTTVRFNPSPLSVMQSNFSDLMVVCDTFNQNDNNKNNNTEITPKK